MALNYAGPTQPKFSLPPPEAYKFHFHDKEYLQDYHGCKVFWPNYEILPEVEQLDAESEDVCIATFPKAGTTFMSAVVQMIMHDGDPKALTEGPTLELKIPYLEMILPGMPVGMRPFDKIMQMPHPRTYFTHLHYAGMPKKVLEKARIVYVARNPKDVIVSTHNFMMSMHKQNGYDNMTLEDTAQTFFDDTCIYAPFYDHVADFWTRRNEPNIFFITFERMLKDFGTVSRDLSKFLGKNLTQEQLDHVMYYCNFDAMKKNELTNRTGIAKTGFFDFNVSPFLRAGKAGNWKEHFSPELNHKVEAWIKKEEDRLQDKLRGFKFEYE